MKLEVRIAGETRIVELERNSAAWIIRLDGQAAAADVAEIDRGTFSILLNGESHEVRITPSSEGALQVQAGVHEFTVEVIDPRAWRGARRGAAEAEGRQPIVAPMPGKVIRVLVGAGEKVEAGQGVLVVEAMKMQNEIRSPKSGTVERILVVEGQAVNAGEVLGWVE